MRRLKLRAQMPLLAKELVEQASRRRTYIVRVVYALLLFAIFCTFSYGEFQRADSRVALLGRGREMFSTLVYIQFCGILLFLPATMSGVLTYEKERRSLALLLLTDLRPREILWQKYFGRLIPMFTFLLLALPPLSICYAFGGITSVYLLTGIYALFLTCFQLGALALMCSAYCRTSVGAFLSSYILGAAFYALFPWLIGGGAGGGSNGLALAFLPLYVFISSGQETFISSLLRSIPTLFSTAFFLGMARAFLVRRAFLPPRNTLLGAFKRLDNFFTEANKWVGSIVLIKDKGTLPGDEPIAWREVTKRSLGKARYLFRIMVLLELPVLFIGAGLLVEATPWRSVGALSAMLAVVWVLAALAVTVMSANAIVSERTHQTLDVLLATPMAGRDILKQKLRGVRRLILVMLIPFFTIFALEAWWRGAVHRYWRPGDAASYLGPSVLSVLIYLPMISWLALWIGLRTRTRFRAIITALLVLVIWVGGPPLALELLNEGLDIDLIRDGFGPLHLLSPATVIVSTEIGWFLTPKRGPASTGLIVMNFVAYGLIYLAFRRVCLAGADRYLGRAHAGGIARQDRSLYHLSGSPRQDTTL